MKPGDIPLALVAHLPEVEITQKIVFEGTKMVNTYRICQDPNAESYSAPREGLGAS